MKGRAREIPPLVVVAWTQVSEPDLGRRFAAAVLACAGASCLFLAR